MFWRLGLRGYLLSVCLPCYTWARVGSRTFRRHRTPNAQRAKVSHGLAFSKVWSVAHTHTPTHLTCNVHNWSILPAVHTLLELKD